MWRQFFKRTPFEPARKLEFILLLFLLPAIIISITPTIYVILWALCGTRTPGNLSHITGYWLKSVLSDASWLRSLVFSACLSFGASTCSLIVIAIRDYFGRLATFGYGRASNALILLALVFPQMVYGMALRYCIGLTHTPAIVGLAAANVILILPVQYIIVESGRAKLTSSQLQSATSLGASTFSGLYRVYFPLMWMPLASGWVVGTLMAFDELVIAMCVWDSTTQPVSKKLWDIFGRAADPTPAAITLIVILSTLLFTLISFGGLYVKSRRVKLR